VVIAAIILILSVNAKHTASGSYGAAAVGVMLP